MATKRDKVLNSEETFETVLTGIKDETAELVEDIAAYLESGIAPETIDSEEVTSPPIEEPHKDKREYSKTAPDQYVIDLKIPYCPLCFEVSTIGFDGLPQCSQGLAKDNKNCPLLKGS